MRWHPPSARWTDSAPLSFSFYVSKCVSLLCFASYACLFCFQWKYLTEMVWRFEDVLWSTLRPGGSYTRERQGRRGRWPRKSRLWTPPQLQGNLSYSTGIGKSFLILPIVILWHSWFLHASVMQLGSHLHKKTLTLQLESWSTSSASSRWLCRAALRREQLYNVHV